MRERTSHSVHCQWVQEFMEHAKELYYREFTEKTDSPEYNYEWTYLEGRVYCVRHKKTGVISLVQASKGTRNKPTLTPAYDDSDIPF